MAYRLSVRAEEDVIGIFLEGAAQFGLLQAEHYHELLKLRLVFLSNHPEAARMRTEIDPAVRILPAIAHLIVYSVDAQGDVFVIRVLHGREDWLSQDL